MKSKKFLIGLCIFLVFSHHSGWGQQTLANLRLDSARLYVEYAVYNGYVNDTIFHSLGKGQLFLGKKSSVYVYQRKSVDEFLKGLGETIENETTRKMVVEGMRESRDLERELAEAYVRYYDSSDYYVLKTLNDGFVWLIDTPHLVFEIKPAFKEINGYKCQLAMGKNISGDPVTIWFTEEIPISSGPLFFYGLPGLIVEYDNPKNKILYKAIRFSTSEIPVDKASDWLNGRVVNKKEWGSILNKDANKMNQMLQMRDN